MKRTFIAIKIPASRNMINIIRDMKVSLKDEKIRWVDRCNLHITLFFIGDTEEELIVSICNGLVEKLNRIESFKLKCIGLGVFKNVYNAKAFWFGVENSRGLQELKFTINEVMRSTGFMVEDRVFKPHITVGRTKFIKDKILLKDLINKYRDIEIQQNKITEVIFFESQLTTKGPIYKTIKTIPLA